MIHTITWQSIYLKKKKKATSLLSSRLCAFLALGSACLHTYATLKRKRAFSVNVADCVFSTSLISNRIWNMANKTKTLCHLALHYPFPEVIRCTENKQSCTDFEIHEASDKCQYWTFAENSGVSVHATVKLKTHGEQFKYTRIKIQTLSCRNNEHAETNDFFDRAQQRVYLWEA